MKRLLWPVACVLLAAGVLAGITQLWLMFSAVTVPTEMLWTTIGFSAATIVLFNLVRRRRNAESQ